MWRSKGTLRCRDVECSGDAADSEANAREALVAKVRGYNEELSGCADSELQPARGYDSSAKRIQIQSSSHYIPGSLPPVLPCICL